MGLGEQALMHGVWRKPRRDGIRPHQFRLDRQTEAFVGKPAQGILGGKQLADLSGRVGERRRHGMPAIKDHAALLGAGALTAKIRTGGLPAPVRIAAESVFPRVLHRPGSAASDSDIAAPIARSALSAKGMEAGEGLWAAAVESGETRARRDG